MIKLLGFGIFLVGFVLLFSGCEDNSTNSSSDLPVTWNHTYGEAGDDFGFDICQTPDGHIIVVGSTESIGNSDGYIYIIVIDDDGQAVIDTHFTAESALVGNAVLSIADGSFLVAGTSGDAAVLIKFDSALGVSFLITFDSPSEFTSYWADDLISTSDGGFLLVGGTYCSQHPIQPYGDVLIIRTNGTGNRINELTYSGGATFGYAKSIISLPNGNYMLAGSTVPGTYICDPGEPCDVSDVIFSQFSQSPDTLWHHRIVEEDAETGHDILSVQDGFLVVGGDGNDVWIGKFNIQRVEQWTKTLIQPSSTEWAEGVAATNDGGYVLIGSTRSLDWTDIDAILIKTDTQGNQIWRRRFGETGIDQGHAVLTLEDGGFVFVGSTTSSGAGGSDVWVVRTDSNGNVL